MNTEPLRIKALLSRSWGRRGTCDRCPCRQASKSNRASCVVATCPLNVGCNDAPPEDIMGEQNSDFAFTLDARGPLFEEVRKASKSGYLAFWWSIVFADQQCADPRAIKRVSEGCKYVATCTPNVQKIRRLILNVLVMRIRLDREDHTFCVAK